MKLIITTTLFFATIFSSASAELTFGPHSNQKARSLGLRGIRTSENTTTTNGYESVDLNGHWGQFHQDGMCIQKIPDTEDKTGDQINFMPCDSTLKEQMWQFTKTDLNINHYYGGMLINMDGGCLAIDGAVGAGGNLKVIKCERHNENQHWLSDGDTTVPRESRDLCIAPITYPIQNGDAAVLLKCEDTFSLDY